MLLPDVISLGNQKQQIYIMHETSIIYLKHIGITNYRHIELIKKTMYIVIKLYNNISC